QRRDENVLAARQRGVRPIVSSKVVSVPLPPFQNLQRKTTPHRLPQRQQRGQGLQPHCFLEHQRQLYELVPRVQEERQERGLQVQRVQVRSLYHYQRVLFLVEFHTVIVLKNVILADQ
ncbi:hypothetical protein AVEN_62479-1, partial [Araneus ventricosus]